jgi:hypothetical protein
MGRNLAGNWARPGQPLLFPSHFSIFRGPTSTQQPCSRRGPAALIWATSEQSSWRTRNQTGFAPFSISLQLTRYRVQLEIESLELFLSYDPVREAPWIVASALWIFVAKTKPYAPHLDVELRRSATPRAQPRPGKAFLAASTTVGSEDGTRASLGGLAVDQEQRSEPPDVARSPCAPPTHKVSKKGHTSSFRCRRDQSHRIWTIVARTGATPVSRVGGAAVQYSVPQLKASESPCTVHRATNGCD